MSDIIIDVLREDGESKTVRVLEGHLFVCKGCCCGNVEGGHPAVPLERFKKEWKERGIRTRVHLTIAGCLGPCAVANVVLLLFDRTSVWFHSINSEDDVVRIYDYIQSLIENRSFVHPSDPLAGKVFQRYLGEPVSCAVGRCE
jgi:cobaltochelatase CobN